MRLWKLLPVDRLRPSRSKHQGKVWWGLWFRPNLCLLLIKRIIDVCSCVEAWSPRIYNSGNNISHSSSMKWFYGWWFGDHYYFPSWRLNNQAIGVQCTVHGTWYKTSPGVLRLVAVNPKLFFYETNDHKIILLLMQWWKYFVIIGPLCAVSVAPGQPCQWHPWSTHLSDLNFLLLLSTFPRCIFWCSTGSEWGAWCVLLETGELHSATAYIWVCNFDGCYKQLMQLHIAILTNTQAVRCMVCPVIGGRCIALCAGRRLPPSQHPRWEHTNSHVKKSANNKKIYTRGHIKRNVRLFL